MLGAMMAPGRRPAPPNYPAGWGGGEPPPRWRQELRPIVNRAIVILLLANAFALLTIRINRAERPTVATGAAGVPLGEGSGPALGRAIADTAAQLATAESSNPADRAQTTADGVLTVRAFELPATMLVPGTKVKPGSTFAAAGIEACPRPGTETAALKVDRQRFSLEIAGGTRVPASAVGKNPVLAATAPPGRCIQGYVSFEIPQGRAAAFLLYDGVPPLRWSLP